MRLDDADDRRQFGEYFATRHVVVRRTAFLLCRGLALGGRPDPGDVHQGRHALYQSADGRHFTPFPLGGW